MTSAGWDDYLAGGDTGTTASESDVAYAGLDAASASAVTTELADAVIADAPTDTAATDAAATDAAATHPAASSAPVVSDANLAAAQSAVDDAGVAQDWGDWNTATADEAAASADSYLQYAQSNAAAGNVDIAVNALDDAAYQAGLANDHYATAGDYHDAAAGDLQLAEQDLGGADASGADASS